MASEYKTRTGDDFDRDQFESLLRRKVFMWPSFEPYGATKGLFDYGPPLENLEAEVMNIWRDHFIRHERMMALKCSMLTPYRVLETSGHVAKFADYMCKDPLTGDILRADHLIKDVIESRLKSDREARGEKVSAVEEDPKLKKKKSKVTKTAVKLDDAVRKEYEHLLATLDDCTGDDMGALIKKQDIRSPISGNEVEPPVSVNLMFQTQIGATGKEPAFLRPETAQGQFLSFQKLLEYSDGQLPMASASIGYSFRNELSPRNGLLRVREFLMAEVEHFVDPESGKRHPKFASVRHVKLPLLDRKTQTEGGSTPTVTTIGEAVDSKLVDNETLGYFLVRIMTFMQRIGMDMNKLRFRQHMANEMAHYAADCWDCELLNSHGWIECVGCADRSAYDLMVHEKATGTFMKVREDLKEPYEVEEWQANLDKKKSGPKLRKDQSKVEAALSELSQEMKEKLSITMADKGKVELPVSEMEGGKVELDKDIVTFVKEKRKVTQREYTPNVIEPSFGVGRILYSLMEHVYWTRKGDEARSVMSFKPTVAPIKVLVVPLQKDTRFATLLSELEGRLDDAQLSFKVDQSGVSIGRRYARNDELGIPFGITVDYESLEGKGFTLRDRDSTKQVRASLDEILEAVEKMCKGKETWEGVSGRLPVFEGKVEEEGKDE
ncbi:Glycine--tRNA ligase 1, mitochondrial [Friedmanniomyces endolithicus]|uniref:glycine--tRNA ligase n=1 Tax=Friedmanniomyces endolithicus TaxID=329885 RepID=A0AAN6QWH8_9PEZI|nr:Glycine--tRNA ligase 1, mitochondrial [Friedmanniomyces endolithicus]KAK0783636.1 Glycine--tRNA ligase 1, mitochondrial [Friedmanniomyces endolithicus]KAK0789161.1 Glycine--tRNA ligase 1, mitochondrial [Friedmanniomyces endolithicus]KAK0799037.1 Glycine--tRNA ligase 1, mitochondrial [Friedmanniomyces endolithicus]KAK0853301.1 Glycine--tRNA ligase 1, mitochondrial [Friedmanniomyces endolithicus]